MDDKHAITISRIYNTEYCINDEDVQDSPQNDQTILNHYEWQLYDHLECKRRW